MEDKKRKPNVLRRIPVLIRWVAAALGVAAYWALAETLVHRGLFATGFYYNRGFAEAFNGRFVFYGVACCILWALFALAVRLFFHFRRRTPAGAAGARGLIGLVALAIWVNLDIVVMYLLYERLDVKVKQGLALPAMVGAPSLIITAGLFFLIIYLWRRPGGVKLKAAFKTASRVILAAGLAIGAVSYGLMYYRSWSRPTPAELPDVVFITLDAWRADSFNAEFAPEMAAFAEREGTVFDYARSPAPCTLQSFAGTLTGSYNVTRCDSMEHRENLRKTWARVMWEQGYDTYAIISNPYLDTVRVLHRGFAYYDYADFNPVLAALHFYDTAWYFAIRGSTFVPEKPGTTSRRLTEKTLRVLRKKTRRPKFVWVHYLDPHYPYQPTEAVLRENAPDLLDKVSYGTDRSKLDEKNVPILRALYDYEIKTTDGCIADVLAELAARPNTLVIISSDHGEEFAEHGQFEHRKTLYDEVIHVPLVISLPESDRGLLPAGRVRTPISTTDLAPSTLAYLGFPIPETMEGRTDIITGGAPQGREVYGTLWHPDGYFLSALVKDDKKNIETIKEGKATYEYFDLAADPGELHPLPLDEDGEALRSRLTAWVPEHVDFCESGADEDAIFGDRADLKALGYVQ